jgi:hypothetical protein
MRALLDGELVKEAQRGAQASNVVANSTGFVECSLLCSGTVVEVAEYVIRLKLCG